MGTELIVALASAAVALISAAIALWGQTKTTQLAAQLEGLRLAEQRRFEAERTVARYREPLARALMIFRAALQIIQQNMLAVYYDKGDEREHSYVVDNTSFLVAQFLCWTEIVRRDIQYIDLGQDEQTSRLARLQDEIYSLFQTDDFDRPFRVFAGEQRAIGERMIKDGPRGLECVGYAAYLGQVTKEGDRLIEALRNDVRDLSANLSQARPRLIAIHHALIDLLKFLDPDFVRFPKERRTKFQDQVNPLMQQTCKQLLAGLSDLVRHEEKSNSPKEGITAPTAAGGPRM